MQNKQFHLISLVAIFVMLLAGCTQPMPIAPSDAPAADSGGEMAAEGGEGAMAGEAQAGGVWTRAARSDATILNPILSSDSVSSNVHTLIFPTLIGQHPFTGVPVTDGSLSESWVVSDDGLTWTFTLRDDVFWSDGEQVDSADFKFTYDAIASDAVESPRKPNVEKIAGIETPDPQTVVVTFTEVKCDGLSDLGLGLLPSHLYTDDFSDIMDNPMNEAPAASAGPMVFQSWARDDNIILTRNNDYFLNAPYMDGMIFRVIPDVGAQLAALQSEEIDVMSLEPTQLTAAKNDDRLNIFRFEDDGYDYIGLNLANPDNPLPGRDDNGDLVEQDPHPILSDINVRKAIAHALDYDAIIDQIYLGEGYPIASNVLPALKQYHDASIQPYDYDLDTANQLLDESGWIDNDGDGIREKDGKKLSLELITNADNPKRVAIGVLAQDQLKEIGMDIDFSGIDFGTMVGQLLGQTYDMVIIGWTGMGADPNDDAFWSSKYDTPNSGFNFVSYQNAEIDQLLEEGLSIPGCAPEERAPIYQQIQQQIHDDVPYVFISGSVGNTGYTNQWAGIDPGEWSFYWNVEKWYLNP